jgi:uncharacterized protein
VRIVLDTNVLVSGLLSPHGAPGQVLDLLVAGEITLIFDDRILAEYREVARRPRFGFRVEDVSRVLDLIRATGEHVVGRPMAVTLPDGSDLPFLEVAAAGRADALVTGNARHFVPIGGHHSVPVLSPRALLDALR